MIFANKKTITKNKQNSFGMINVILFTKRIFRWIYYLLRKRKYNSGTNIRSYYMNKKVKFQKSNFLRGSRQESFVLFIESWIIFVKNIWF